MKRALYAGSFDPLTYGHLDILNRAAGLVDELIVIVSASTAKRYLFSTEERLEMVETSLKEIDVKNCRVFAYDGLTAKFAEDNDINVLIRGIRSVKDFEYERDIAELNAMQSEAIETVFLIADSKYQSVSSTMVKEIAYYGGELQELVPAHVDDRVKKASQKVEK